MTSRTTLATRPRLALAVAAGGASLALVLAGCAGGPTPVASGSETGSATTSATATPTATYKPADAKGRAENVLVPVLPEAAKAETKEGLEAFTKYWYQLLNYAQETGDLSPWSGLTASDCVFCNNLRTSVETGYKMGRWQVGGRLTTPSVEAKLTPGTSTQQVIVQVLQEETKYFKADGTVGRTPEPASNSATVVIATYKDSSWSVADMHLLQ